MCLDHLDAPAFADGFQFSARHHAREFELVGVVGASIAQRQRRIRGGGHFQEEFPRVLGRRLPSANSGIGRGKPGRRVKLAQAIGARHHAEVDAGLLPTFFLGATLGQSDAVEAKTLVAKRVLEPVKQREAANHQRPVRAS